MSTLLLMGSLLILASLALVVAVFFGVLVVGCLCVHCRLVYSTLSETNASRELGARYR